MPSSSDAATESADAPESHPGIAGTLRSLFTEPGRLTAGWRSGRTEGRPGPGALYLGSLAVLLVGMWLLAAAEPGTGAAGGFHAAAEGFVEGWTEGGSAEGLPYYPSEAAGGLFISAVLADAMRAAAPLVLLLSAPLLALILSVVFWGDRPTFRDHLTFSAHFHSVAFLTVLAAGLVGVALPSGGWWVNALALVVLVYLLVHGVRAFRHVYGPEAPWSGTRGTLALGGHGLLVILLVILVGSAHFGAAGPHAREDAAHEAYWTAYERHGSGDPAGWREAAWNALVRYQQLEGYLHGPHVQAHVGRLRLDTGDPARALALARQGLVEDSSHLPSLALAADAAARLDREELRREYHRRFLEAYEGRIGEYETGERNRHLSPLESTREEAREEVRMAPGEPAPDDTGEADKTPGAP